MNTLIIDTTKSKMFIGLEKNKEMSNATVNGIGRHNTTLMPTIDNLLKDNGLDLADINVVAINNGPGSFTGIRVGVSTVKAFMVALKELKCVSFSSLELIARETNNAKCEVILSAGNNDNYYVAKVENNKVISQRHYTLSEFNEVSHEVIFALSEEKDMLSKIEVTNYIDNVDYFECVNEKVAGEVFESNKTLEPIYLRLSQAERELNAKNNNK